MKGTEIVLSTLAGRKCAGLFVDGKLFDLVLDSDRPRPGTVYRAKAVRPVKGMGGMFFDTPDGSAFLRSAKGMSTGEYYTLQVTGYAEAGKAIPVTPKLSFKGRYAIATPGAPGVNIARSIKDEEARVFIREVTDDLVGSLDSTGLIIRTSASDANAEDLLQDAAAMIDLSKLVQADESQKIDKLVEGPDVEEFAWREWPLSRPVEGDLTDTLRHALSRDTTLKGGGSLSIEPTRAFVAIDVNTGVDTSPASGLKANIEAARALPTALRVKGLGGQIVIDCAPMPKKDRRAFEAALRTAVRSDSIETSLVGWTTLGHFEVSRKRERVPLHEILSLGELP